MAAVQNLYNAHIMHSYDYLTIRPVARKGYRPIANEELGEAEWAIDPWLLRAKGLIVLVSPS